MQGRPGDLECECPAEISGQIDGFFTKKEVDYFGLFNV